MKFFNCQPIMETEVYRFKCKQSLKWFCITYFDSYANKVQCLFKGKNETDVIRQFRSRIGYYTIIDVECVK